MRVQLWASALVAGLVLLPCEVVAKDSTCTEKKWSDYNGSKVLEVDLKSLTGFISPFGSGLEPLKNGLEIQENQKFQLAKLNADTASLGAQIRSGSTAGKQKLKVVVVTPDLVECQGDPGTGSLKVVYNVFTNVLSPSFDSVTAPSIKTGNNPPTIETKTSESERPATTGAVRGADGKF